LPRRILPGPLRALGQLRCSELMAIQFGLRCRRPEFPAALEFSWASRSSFRSATIPASTDCSPRSTPSATRPSSRCWWRWMDPGASRGCRPRFPRDSCGCRREGRIRRATQLSGKRRGRSASLPTRIVFALPTGTLSLTRGRPVARRGASLALLPAAALFGFERCPSGSGWRRRLRQLPPGSSPRRTALHRAMTGVS
jgi:hypothetical protein